MSNIYSSNYTGYVYIWFDTIRKLFYIGSHKGLVEDSYICSNKIMKCAYKSRPHTFKMRVLEYCNSDLKHLHSREQYWLNMIKPEETYQFHLSKDNQPKSVRYYNIKRLARGGGGESQRGVPKSETHKANMRKPKCESHKQNTSIGLKLAYKNGFKHPRGMLGKHHTEKSKELLRLAMTGRKFTEEHRKNMSKPKCEIQKQKFRESVQTRLSRPIVEELKLISKKLKIKLGPNWSRKSDEWLENQLKELKKLYEF